MDMWVISTLWLLWRVEYYLEHSHIWAHMFLFLPIDCSSRRVWNVGGSCLNLCNMSLLTCSIKITIKINHHSLASRPPSLFPLWKCKFAPAAGMHLLLGISPRGHPWTEFTLFEDSRSWEWQIPASNWSVFNPISHSWYIEHFFCAWLWIPLL